MQWASRFWKFLRRASCLVGWPRRKLPSTAGCTMVLAGPPIAPIEGTMPLQAQLGRGAAAPLERLAARGMVIAARIDRPGANGMEFCAVLRLMPTGERAAATEVR